LFQLSIARSKSARALTDPAAGVAVAGFGARAGAGDGGFGSAVGGAAFATRAGSAPGRGGVAPDASAPFEAADASSERGGSAAPLGMFGRVELDEPLEAAGEGRGVLR
jgi:hypothetical protein